MATGTGDLRRERERTSDTQDVRALIRRLRREGDRGRRAANGDFVIALVYIVAAAFALLLVWAVLSP